MFYIGSISNDPMPIIELVYNISLNQWQTSDYIPSTQDIDNGTLYIFGTSTSYYMYNGLYSSMIASHIDTTSVYQQYSIITNTNMVSAERASFASYSNDLTQLPQGLTESDVRDIIDQQINTQTASGSIAQNIINSTTQNYNLYINGDIDSAQMQQIISNNLDTLSDLTPSTLLDSIQINNALTYNQAIQDQILNNASDAVTQLFDRYIRLGASYTYYRYQQGEKTQQDANQEFNNQIRALSNEVTSGAITSTADIEALNAMINMIQSYQSMVYNEKDLDVDVSDKVQQSDDEEIEYLEQLTSEVTSTITDIAPSQNFTASQTGDAQQVFELVWQNEFVKKMLPMCAGFMVVCVVLGIKYKV